MSDRETATVYFPSISIQDVTPCSSRYTCCVGLNTTFTLRVGGKSFCEVRGNRDGGKSELCVESVLMMVRGVMDEDTKDGWFHSFAFSRRKFVATWKEEKQNLRSRDCRNPNPSSPSFSCVKSNSMMYVTVERRSESVDCVMVMISNGTISSVTSSILTSTVKQRKGHYRTFGGDNPPRHCESNASFRR